MNDQIPRLHAVRTSEEGADERIPMDVLRFATLSADRRRFLLQVNDLLGQIEYGAVVIVMHEGRITQIETSEKMRLT